MEVRRRYDDLLASLDRIETACGESKPLVIDVHGTLVHSAMHCVVEAARQGLGLAFVYRRFVEDHIRSGDLVQR